MRVFKAIFNKSVSSVVLSLLFVFFAFAQTTVVFAAYVDGVSDPFYTFDGIADTTTMPSGITLTNVSEANKSAAKIVNGALMLSRRGGSAEPSAKFTFTTINTQAVVDFKIKKNALISTKVQLGGGGGSMQCRLDFNAAGQTVVTYNASGTGSATGDTITAENPYPLNEFFPVRVTLDYSTFKMKVWVNGELVVDGYKNGGTSLMNMTFFASGISDVYVDDVFMRDVGTSTNLTDDRKIAVVKDMLTYNDLSPRENPQKITSNLTLPTELALPAAWETDTTIEWASTDSATINPLTGVVTRPEIGQPDKNVTLTATISKGSEEPVTKAFNFKVLSRNVVYQTDFSDWTYSSTTTNTTRVETDVPIGKLNSYRVNGTGVTGETTAVTGNETEDLFNSVFQYQRYTTTSPSDIVFTTSSSIAYPAADQELAISFKYKPSRTTGENYAGEQSIAIGREDGKNRMYLVFNKTQNGLLQYQYSNSAGANTTGTVDGFELGTGATHDLSFIIYSNLTYSIVMDEELIVNRLPLIDLGDKAAGAYTIKFYHNSGVGSDASIIDDLSIVYRPTSMLYQFGNITICDASDSVLTDPADNTTGAFKIYSDREFLMNGLDDIDIIAALYDDDNRILSASILDNATDLYINGITLSNEEFGGTRIKLFAWNLDNLTPYAIWDSE